MKRCRIVSLTLLAGMVLCVLVCASLWELYSQSATSSVTPSPGLLELPYAHNLLPPLGPGYTLGAWSPDSTMLAVNYLVLGVHTKRISRIYLVDASSGTQRVLLETSRGTVLAMDWLPNGRIAYYAYDSYVGRSGIQLVNVGNEKNMERELIGNLPGTHSFLQHVRIATWSPDGNLMVFIHYDEAGKSDGIQLVNGASGEEIIEGTRILPWLSWSPDGQKIAFSLFQDPETANMYVMDITTKRMSRLTSRGYSYMPSWSPSGQLLSYVDGYAHQLMIVSSDGQCVFPILPGEEVTGALWSPDGHWIAFEWKGGIYLLDVEAVLGKEFLDREYLCPTPTGPQTETP